MKMYCTCSVRLFIAAGFAKKSAKESDVPWKDRAFTGFWALKGPPPGNGR